jgi:hypothetical protein
MSYDLGTLNDRAASSEEDMGAWARQTSVFKLNSRMPNGSCIQGCVSSKLLARKILSSVHRTDSGNKFSSLDEDKSLQEAWWPRRSGLLLLETKTVTTLVACYYLFRFRFVGWWAISCQTWRKRKEEKGSGSAFFVLFSSNEICSQNNRRGDELVVVNRPRLAVRRGSYFGGEIVGRRDIMNPN